MTEEQHIRLDLLRSLDYDIDKAAAAYNFVKGVADGEQPCDLTTFDLIHGYEGGFAVVERGDKYNFIDKHGALLCSTWYDKASDFEEGFALVQLGGKYNFLNDRGELLSDTWYDYAEDFFEGSAYVENGEEKYFIDTDGKRQAENESK